MRRLGAANELKWAGSHMGRELPAWHDCVAAVRCDHPIIIAAVGRMQYPVRATDGQFVDQRRNGVR
jgi:hypothetical protein